MRLAPGAPDALVDRWCLPQGRGGLTGVAFVQVNVADSLQGARLLRGRGDVAGDGQRPGVVLPGLRHGRDRGTATSASGRRRSRARPELGAF
jgi:hypothetical protein